MALSFRPAVVLVAACAVSLAAGAAEMSGEPLATIKQAVDAQQAVLVDVREEDETEAGHVEGAVLLPTTAIRDGLSESELAALPRDKTLYVHCVVGARALSAAEAFEKHGLDARPIASGFDELVAAGFPKAPARAE